MSPTTTNNSRHPYVHRAAGALAAAAVTVLVALGLSTAPAVAADACPNAAVRAQTDSIRLPDCRGYEMVSAPYKEGFDVELINLGFTDDGLVAYGSLGSFAGNPLGIILNRYHATRSATGWANTSIAPSAQRYDTNQGTADAESADLRWSLWKAYRRDVPGDKFGFLLRGPDGVVTRIGDAEDPLLGKYAGLAGASADLSHVVSFYGEGGPLFEHVGTGNGAPRAVSVDNQGVMQGVCFNRMSTDGRVIVYTAGCPTGVPQVWARVAGSASVLVSGSECTRNAGDPGGACNAVAGAKYWGGAVDGSRVFFTTSQQLVNGDTDAGADLYTCDIPAGVPVPVGSANRCATLTQVSGAASDARVENVVSVSKDGSRVYFVAQGVLADNLGVGGIGAVAGVSNLYMWQRDGANPAGTTRFVAGLAAGSDLSRQQMTPDGRYLLFLTAKPLVTDGPGADTDSAVDAYRYDAVTRSMVRVSTSVSGAGGNGSGFDVAMHQGSSIAADGSTVIFDSAEPLSASDTNGVTDVYAWHADRGVSLISSGGGVSVWITPSGRDIFFGTNAQVLASDGDFNQDLYDARVGGGFAPAQTSSCSGDGCKGLPTAPPLLGGPGGGGSGGGDAEEGVRPAIGGIARLSASARSVLARGGRARLRLRVNRAGTVVLAGRAKVGAKSRRVVWSSARAKRAGRVSVAFALSRGARVELGRRGSLTVGLTVRFNDARPRTLTVTLTAAKKPKSGRGGSR